jgi:hypothetical protein
MRLADESPAVQTKILNWQRDNAGRPPERTTALDLSGSDLQSTPI